MIKTRTSNKIDRFFGFFKYWNFRKVESKKKEETFKSNSQNNIVSGYLGNDIFISRAGQVKIDNLDSCLNLVRSDFIVF